MTIDTFTQTPSLSFFFTGGKKGSDFSVLAPRGPSPGGRNRGFGRGLRPPLPTFPLLPRKCPGPSPSSCILVVSKRSWASRDTKPFFSFNLAYLGRFSPGRAVQSNGAAGLLDCPEKVGRLTPSLRRQPFLL